MLLILYFCIDFSLPLIIKIPFYSILETDLDFYSVFNPISKYLTRNQDIYALHHPMRSHNLCVTYALSGNQVKLCDIRIDFYILCHIFIDSSIFMSYFY